MRSTPDFGHWPGGIRVCAGLSGRISVMGTSMRKSYTPEYWCEAARLVIDMGRTIVAVAGEVGVGAQLWAGGCNSGTRGLVVGRTVGDSLHTDPVGDALRRAVVLRGHLPRTVIFHADRGTPYTSGQAPRIAAELGVPRSMGAPGSAGAEPPRNRSGRRRRTSNTTGTCSCPSTPADARQEKPVRPAARNLQAPNP